MWKEYQVENIEFKRNIPHRGVAKWSVWQTLYPGTKDRCVASMRPTHQTWTKTITSCNTTNKYNIISTSYTHTLANAVTKQHGLKPSITQ